MVAFCFWWKTFLDTDVSRSIGYWNSINVMMEFYFRILKNTTNVQRVVSEIRRKSRYKKILRSVSAVLGVSEWSIFSSITQSLACFEPAFRCHELFIIVKKEVSTATSCLLILLRCLETGCHHHLQSTCTTSKYALRKCLLLQRLTPNAVPCSIMVEGQHYFPSILLSRLLDVEQVEK